MQITNERFPISTLSLNYVHETPATIVKDTDDTKNQNTVGVYIPRLMFGIDASNGAKDETVSINTDCIINTSNKNIGASSAKSTNYVVVPLYIVPNSAVPKFKKGEHVIVDFADNDIKSIYVLPIKMNEMYSRQTDLLSFYVPAKANESDEIKSDNIYTLQFDSEEKLITIIMNNANGEKSKYYIGINGKKGEMYANDNNKRFIKIITDDDIIVAQNEAGAFCQMKQGTINVECDDLNVKVKNKISIKSNETEIKTDTVKETITTQTSNIDTYNSKGTSKKEEYTTIKRKGTKSDDSFSSAMTQDSPVVGISGVATVGGLGFEPITLGTKPLPISSSIDSTGSANFGKPSPIGKPLAIASYTLSALTTIATVVDALGLMFGVPPTLVTSMTSMQAILPSNRVKG